MGGKASSGDCTADCIADLIKQSGGDVSVSVVWDVEKVFLEDVEIR